MPDWIATGFDEYARRMPPELRIELREIKPEQRSSGRPAESVMSAERLKIEAALPKNARIVVVEKCFADAFGVKALPHDRVVHEFAENGEGRFGRELLGLGDGVAHAETDPEMFSQDNFHRP